MRDRTFFMYYCVVVLGLAVCTVILSTNRVHKGKVTNQKPFELEEKIYQCKQVEIKNE